MFKLFHDFFLINITKQETYLTIQYFQKIAVITKKSKNFKVEIVAIH